MRRCQVRWTRGVRGGEGEVGRGEVVGGGRSGEGEVGGEGAVGKVEGRGAEGAVRTGEGGEGKAQWGRGKVAALPVAASDVGACLPTLPHLSAFPLLAPTSLPLLLPANPSPPLRHLPPFLSTTPLCPPLSCPLPQARLPLYPSYPPPFTSLSPIAQPLVGLAIMAAAAARTSGRERGQAEVLCGDRSTAGSTASGGGGGAGARGVGERAGARGVGERAGAVVWGKGQVLWCGGKGRCCGVGGRAGAVVWGKGQVLWCGGIAGASGMGKGQVLGTVSALTGLELWELDKMAR
ncbi:unnamed protein product [Closterium sp. Naga37s-1]|nr:unnamed protein product [Closterium sp. Naga37s-1]